MVLEMRTWMRRWMGPAAPTMQLCHKIDSLAGPKIDDGTPKRNLRHKQDISLYFVGTTWHYATDMEMLITLWLRILNTENLLLAHQRRNLSKKKKRPIVAECSNHYELALSGAIGAAFAPLEWKHDIQWKDTGKYLQYTKVYRFWASMLDRHQIKLVRASCEYK